MRHSCTPPSPDAHGQATLSGEEIIMPKSKRGSRETPAAEDTQKLYARAYASRLAKEVSEAESPRRAGAPRKRRDGKR
jgi:hypothetical protein